MPLGRFRLARSRFRPGGLPSRPQVMRAGPRSILYGRRMARGGFFKSIGKIAKGIIKTVKHVPVLNAVAKAAVGSLPIVGQVQTAVNAFKKKTPVGVAASPVGGIQPTPAQSLNASTNRRSSPKRTRRAKKAKTAKAKPRKARKSKAKGKRKGGGTAKQRAARARFAAAARKGRIKKGQRLGG